MNSNDFDIEDFTVSIHKTLKYQKNIMAINFEDMKTMLSTGESLTLNTPAKNTNVNHENVENKNSDSEDTDNEDNELTNNEEPSQNKESLKIKSKLYRNIAKHCHPDKCKNKEISNNFKNISKKSSVSDLIIFAKSNHIPIDDIKIDDETKKLVEDNLHSLIEEISKNAKDPIFLWTRLSLEEKQQVIQNIRNNNV
uniref:J domain-containing protein n=1 Tax=viral metagenome TaxID=1070528 RepID=A0A6C0FDP4_9ZZZZ|tara:strand:+ start:8026 stop:8613 length:588 start_codon:yes stop_codon:yes gene_type:complete